MSLFKQLMEDLLGRRAPASAGKNRRDPEQNASDTIRDLPRFSDTDQDIPAEAFGRTPEPGAALNDVKGKPWRKPEQKRARDDSGAVSPTVDAAHLEGTESSKPALLVGAAVGVLALMLGLALTGSAVGAAKQRLLQPDANRPGIALAQEAELSYCTPDFKQVLERVLHSCGLAEQSERRGCKPSDIKTFAAISDADFNSLFLPLQQRGGVLMFDESSDVLDEQGKSLLEKRWFERKGARYFFVVARASRTGNPEKNRALSHRRANSVLFHLKEISGETEAELNQKVGLLWLGNEYAQLPKEYCAWPRSRDAGRCDEEAVNRSAFVSWVDCRL